MKSVKSIALFCLLIILFSSCTSVTSTAPSQNSVLIKTNIQSKSLSKDMKVNIYLPKGYNGKTRYPVLYMLHGYTDNEDCWMVNLNLKIVADRLINDNMIEPVIIVMPQIDNSFGVNSDKSIYLSLKYSAGLYEDYLYKDLIPNIDKYYKTIKNRNSRYIGGLSMGGYAALHLAFNHSELFSKVGGHSPALLVEDSWLYPNDQIRLERDPMLLVISKKVKNIEVYLDCGDKDSFKFYNSCETLAHILQNQNIQYEYHLNPGEHNKEYWNANSDKYLMFYVGKEKASNN